MPKPVSPPSPFRTVHATFTAHGSTPVGHFVSGHCSPTSHRDSPGFTFGYLSYWESQPAVGLPPVRGFPTRQVLRPHRHSLGSRRFATGLPATTVRSPSHPVGSFPCSRSWTSATPGRWRLPDLPSALCGSPTCSRIGRPSERVLFPLTGAERVRLLLRLGGCRIRWLSS